MPISLYDGSIRSWVNTNVNQQTPRSMTDQLMLNILIELRLHTQYLSAMNLGIVLEDPQVLRVDEANSYPVNG